MAFRKALNLLEIVIRVFLMLLMTTSVVSIFGQVIFRYVFNNALVWSEEVARFSLIWMTLLGSAVAVRKWQHLFIDSVLNKCSHKVKEAAALLFKLSLLAFCALMCKLGWQLTEITWKAISPATKISMGWIYLSLTLGFGFMSLFMVESIMNTIGRLRGKGNHEAAEAAEVC